MTGCVMYCILELGPCAERHGRRSFSVVDRRRCQSGLLLGRRRWRRGLLLSKTGGELSEGTGCRSLSLARIGLIRLALVRRSKTDSESLAQATGCLSTLPYLLTMPLTEVVGRGGSGGYLIAVALTKVVGRTGRRLSVRKRYGRRVFVEVGCGAERGLFFYHRPELVISQTRCPRSKFRSVLKPERQKQREIGAEREEHVLK